MKHKRNKSSNTKLVWLSICLLLLTLLFANCIASVSGKEALSKLKASDKLNRDSNLKLNNLDSNNEKFKKKDEKFDDQDEDDEDSEDDDDEESDDEDDEEENFVDKDGRRDTNLKSDEVLDESRFVSDASSKNEIKNKNDTEAGADNHPIHVRIQMAMFPRNADDEQTLLGMEKDEVRWQIGFLIFVTAILYIMMRCSCSKQKDCVKSKDFISFPSMKDCYSSNSCSFPQKTTTTTFTTSSNGLNSMSGGPALMNLNQVSSMNPPPPYSYVAFSSNRQPPQQPPHSSVYWQTSMPSNYPNYLSQQPPQAQTQTHQQTPEYNQNYSYNNTEASNVADTGFRRRANVSPQYSSQAQHQSSNNVYQHNNANTTFDLTR